MVRTAKRCSILKFLGLKRLKGSPYKYFTPEKDVWYYYKSYDKCDEGDLKKRNLVYTDNYGHPVECFEIRPFAYIGGEKVRAKFKISKNKCIIITKDIKKEIDLTKCSFAYQFKFYHHKNIRSRKGPELMTPSGYGEFHVSVLVKN